MSIKRLRTKNLRHPLKTRSAINYAVLEPRKMLSVDLDPARNLIVNGDFENDDSTAFAAFADGDESNLQEIKIVTVSTQRSNIVELDAAVSQIDSLAQDIETEADEDYLLSFDLRGRPVNDGEDAVTNSVEVLFGGESVGTFTGIGKWQTINLYVAAQSDLTRLEFREASTESDGTGILLDHVSLTGVRSSLVENGSLENIDADASAGVVDSDDLPGFHAIGDPGDLFIGVQVVDDAAHGNHVLNLNSSESRLDRVFKNLRTETGSTYYLTFDLRNGNPDDSNPVNIRFRWNNQFAGSFYGTSQWQKYGVLLKAVDDFSTLVIREPGINTGSGSAPQIDHIQIFRVDSLASDFVLDLNGDLDGQNHSGTFVENSTTALTNDNLSLSFNNGSILTSATVRILGFSGTEELSVTRPTGLQANFDNTTGILRLVGRSNVENYQRALRSIVYADASDDPSAGPKRVIVSVTDGTAISDRPAVVLEVVPVNDAPRATPLPDIPLPLNNTLTVNVGVIDPDDTDLNFEIIVDGDSEIFAEFPSISDLGQLQLTAIRDGIADITIIVSDSDGLTSEFTFRVEAPYELPAGSIPPDFVPFSGQGQLSNTAPALREDIYDSPPPLNIDLTMNYQGVIETVEGEIRFDLFAQASPITANNFINLARDGYYDGVSFHRVLENSIAQGGDPSGDGTGGPGYTFADELNNGLQFEGFGQLAMANAGPNTNGSQFFFTLNDNPAVVGEHTIFGQVVDGADVLRAVNLTSSGNPEIIRRIRIEIV